MDPYQKQIRVSVFHLLIDVTKKKLLHFWINKIRYLRCKLKYFEIVDVNFFE